MKLKDRLITPFLVLAAWLLVICGRVKVKGYLGTYRALRSGGNLIIANHPSLPETIVIPTLFWLWGLTRHESRIPWSVADDQLFGGSISFYPSLRCIPVSRKEPRKYPTSKEILRRLSSGGNVCVYPEGGRTGKGDTFITVGERRVRPCVAKPVRLAALAGAMVLPVWVDNPNADRPSSFLKEYWRLWTGERMVITFGQPREVSADIDGEDVALMLLAVVNRFPRPD